jgi:hypothetical protein
MKRYFILSTLVFFLACGTTKIVQPMDADVQRGADNFPTLSLAQLNQGLQVYQTNCSKCHPYKKPASRTAMEWKQIVPRMVDKANSKHGAGIDAAGEEALLRYVSVMSSAPKR